MKLGKLAPKAHPKTLRFGAFLLPDAPPPPPAKLWREYKIPEDAWGMFGNDTIGDCTCAGIAHLLMLVTAHTGGMVVPDEKDVIEFYSAVSGYDPSTGANDNGAAITDVLDRWQSVGFSGHKIVAWAGIEPANFLHRHQGMYIFGGNNVGVELPAIAQQQFADNATWDVPSDGNDGGIEGGHCIIEAGYGADGSDFVSWGRGTQKATNAWSQKYMDEAYVVITQDWIDNATGLAPNMMNMDALVAALAALKA
jgi:hypothetical protein